MMRCARLRNSGGLVLQTRVPLLCRRLGPRMDGSSELVVQCRYNFSPPPPPTPPHGVNETFKMAQVATRISRGQEPCES